MMFNHVEKQTKDGTQLNLNALYQIAPSSSAVTYGVVRDYEELRNVITQ